jgi:glycosyltransferase involved in cell wall biosynthesis
MDFPKYTAYVPVYNQAATLGDSLASLAAQNVPPAEILVVDDCSTDGSPEIALAAGAKLLRQNINLGRGAARARAIISARHDFVLGCDAGNRLPADFAARALAHFSGAPRLAAVHGWFAQSRSGDVVQRWRSRHLFNPAAEFLHRQAVHVTSGYVIRRDAAIEVGNYAESLRAGEDAELGQRLQAAGWEIWLDPALRIECLTKDTIATVFERYARWNETPAPLPGTRFWRDYLRRCAYAIKVLARRDLRDGDVPSLALTLALPHYLALRAWRRKRDPVLMARVRFPLIHYVNPYAEPWLERCWNGQGISRAHLWGADALVEAGFPVQPVRSRAPRPLLRTAQWLSRLSGGRLGDLAADIALLRRARRGDLIYVASGNLLLAPLAARLGLLRAPIIAWIYKPLEPFSWRTLRGLYSSRFILRGYNGWLALTPGVETWLRRELPAARTRRVVWTSDTNYYPPSSGPGAYFLASGVTQRDFATLLAAARSVDFPFTIIGPAEWQPRAPGNVTWKTRDPGQPHATVDDDQLRELYHNARAVLIPLQPDPNDASGFTNLLEAIACGRPVVMTRTGALDLTPAALDIGFDIAPGDTAAWVLALTTLAQDPGLAQRFGARAAQLARDYFNLPRFERDLTQYFLDFMLNRPEPPPSNPLAQLTPQRIHITPDTVSPSSAQSP